MRLAAEGVAGWNEELLMVRVFIVTPPAMGVTCSCCFCAFACIDTEHTSALQVNLLTGGKGKIKSPTY